MTDRPAHQFQPRPRLISADDFARLADIAWHDDPRLSLQKQVSRALNVSEMTVQRWMRTDDKASPVPVDILRKTLDRADKRLAEAADLLDQVAAVVKAQK